MQSQDEPLFLGDCFAVLTPIVLPHIVFNNIQGAQRQTTLKMARWNMIGAGLDNTWLCVERTQLKNKISGCVNQRNELVRAKFKRKKPDFITKIWLLNMAPRAGLEPATKGLTVLCSTN